MTAFLHGCKVFAIGLVVGLITLTTWPRLQAWWWPAGFCRGDEEGAVWQAMATAPRDGTTVELCCARCRTPWYGLYAWTQTVPPGPVNGETIPRIYPQETVSVTLLPQDGPITLDAPKWSNLVKAGYGIGNEAFFVWRRPATRNPRIYESLNVNQE
jgi:hypothetical protein